MVSSQDDYMSLNNPGGDGNSSNPVGRPSEYNPDYCQQVIKHMSTGLSFESFAGKLLISKQTLYRWRKEYPEFSDAVDCGFNACQLFWETQGVDGLYSSSSRDSEGNSTSKSMNAPVWKFNMQNRFKWRESSEVMADIKTEDKKDERLNQVLTLLQSEFKKD